MNPIIAFLLFLVGYFSIGVATTIYLAVMHGDTGRAHTDWAPVGKDLLIIATPFWPLAWWMLLLFYGGALYSTIIDRAVSLIGAILESPRSKRVSENTIWAGYTEMEKHAAHKELSAYLHGYRPPQ